MGKYLENLARSLMHELKFTQKDLGLPDGIVAADILGKVRSQVQRMRPETVGRIVAAGNLKLRFYWHEQKLLGGGYVGGYVVMTQESPVYEYLLGRIDAKNLFRDIACITLIAEMREVRRRNAITRHTEWLREVEGLGIADD